MNNASGTSMTLSLEKKRALLGQLLVEKASKPAHFRLSFAQQRLWVLNQLEPGMTAYNNAGAVRLKGVLNIPALQQTLDEIVRRHEALRTTFSFVDENSIQVVHPPGRFPLDLCDISHLPEWEIETKVRAVATEEAETRFDLGRWPLLRGKLLRLGAEEHVLLLTMHHIVSDGWSVGVLVRELGVLYEAYAEGKGSPLQELGIQYADYAEWQREYLQGEVLEEQLGYWRKQLGGELPVVELPSDHVRPAVRSYRGAQQELRASREVTEKLKQVSREEGATLFMTLLAAFAVLLARYSGQEELVVGTPIANRTRVETEELIGCFVNTLVLRVDAGGNPRFRELVQRVKQVALEGYAHQDLPFEKLVEELQPKRDLSRTPLFQVMFVLQNAPMPEVKLGGLKLSGVEIDRQVAKFDLTVTMGETEEGLAGVVEYNTDLFEAGTMERMVGHWERLLKGIAEDAEQRVWELPLMGEAERRQVVEEWNQTASAFPATKCLHELIERQATVSPHSIAVTFGEQFLTYGELNARANQLAHYLRSRGVRSETLVGVLLERSLDMLVGLLGILKAGGAYVALDPAYPADRISFMMEDSRMPVVLTHDEGLPTLLANGVDAIFLDREWQRIAKESPENLNHSVMPGDLAYVIYTSGSTGRPKGVMVEHRSVVNLLKSIGHEPGMTSRDIVLAITTLSFDIAAFELYLPLIIGARVEMVTRDVVLDPTRLSDKLRSAQATVMQATPATWRMLIDAGWAGDQGLKILCTGEVLPVDLANELVGRGESVWNLYGPTETTIWSTLCRVERSDSASVPIGRPIANTQLYVLDRWLNPAPIGIPGELHIGGVGLARGYWNRPELTAEKFIPGPFRASAGARLYKTGDLARYRADGVIEYVGRIDHQVKIRGFRIELGEIEAVLMQHKGVSECVVLAREDAPGQKRLVAYVVAEKQAALTVPELRNWVKERLPEYMVPAAFVMLLAIPVTQNGKVDRRALPIPDSVRPELEQGYVAPRMPAEETLARIWAEVLKLERVGVHDNFFELGGDSILGIQAISRANQVGLFLTSKQLFQHQTIAELATVADQIQPMEAEQGLITGAVPLTPVQCWFFEQELSCPQHWNQAVLVQLREPAQIEPLRKAIEHILAHHDALRLTFTRDESGWHQVNAGLKAETPFITRDLSGVSPEELRSAIEEIAAHYQSSLSLAEEPLLRAILLKPGGAGRDRLLIIVHHLAIDGVSWRILLEDLQAAYLHMRRGEQIILPPKTTSFSKWASELNAYAQSNSDLRAEYEYWSKQSWAAVRPLPVDRPDGVNTEGSAESVTVSLTAVETQALLRDAPEVYHTHINDFLLTALVRTLGQWSGTDTIALDLEGHGREEILPGLDVGRTIGWFTSIFPICLQCSLEAELGPSLKSIKEQLRAVPSRGIGYGLLRYLGPPEIREKLKHHLQPQIQFNYLGQFDNVASESSLFAPATEAVGPCQDPSNLRRYLVQGNCSVSAGQLHIAWSYSRNVHYRSTMERLAEQYLRVLRSLIEHCQTSSAGGYSPSDFPLAKLDQAQLDRLLGNSRLIEDVYPLSPTQHGLLFHTLYAPHSGTYFMQLSFKLEGEFDGVLFQEAWREVVERHTTLRTAFKWQEMDEPLQIVFERVEVPFDHLDWSKQSEAEQEKLLHLYLQEQRRQGFDLSQAPLLRLTLIDLGAGAYQFVWAWSHLILDGWCVPVVLKEVFLSYQERSGRAKVTIRHSPPYRDYIAWLQKQDLSKAEAFWRQALKGFYSPTPLVIDQRVTASGGGDYCAQSTQLSVEASAELQAFARRQQVTLNVVTEAAWALLLSRYTGERDVVFGATVSGRSAVLPQVESMLGLFINTLPVRVRIGSDDLPGPWLRKLQAEQVELLEYEYSPLVQVHEWSELQAGTGLFDSILVFENYPVDSSGEWDHNLQISNVRSFERTNYPLTLIVVPGKQFSLRVLYERDRFEEESIARLLRHYTTFLQGLATLPDCPIYKLPMLTGDEQRQQIIERNKTAMSFSENESVHQLFEMQAQQTPYSIAVACEDERISYEDLNRRSTQLARYLRERGVGRDSLVAVCVERSIDMLVGLLGILKAGGAYVPIDPTYPRDRIAFMLADASVHAILTQQALLGNIPQNAVSAVCLDRDWSEISSSREGSPLPRVSPESLAYVMYTSGSTGKPKGVMVQHRSVVNFLESMRREPGMTSRDVLLAVTTLSFDIAALELYLPLIAGARVEIATRDVALDPTQLANNLRSVRATAMQATPATWRMLIDSGWKGDRHLKILCGGEVLPPELVDELLPRGESVWNLYGPTETTIWSTLHKVERTQSTSVPIGRPIANTQTYILDGHGNLVPDGVAGELYIAGAGLARGYLNRPELTAERFVPNPFVAQASARMYRTGDLVRYRTDGLIEYLGRTDHQVKIRGHRIELGEIETIIEEHDSVGQAVVVAREFGAGDKRLIAYVSASPGPTPVPSELSALLRSKLPGYMIPSAFVRLDQFPLTPNGKIDRKALPVPNQPETGASTQPVAARDGLELQLKNIWERVLRIRPIGIRENFFELGGHSLLAVRLFAEMEKVFGKNIPLATLFQAPTIEELAKVLRRDDWSSAWSSLIALQPSGSAAPFFCVHSLGANLVSYAQLARHIGVDQPFYGLQPIGLDGKESPDTRVEDMATHYLREIRAIQPEGPYYLGGVCLGGVVAFEMSQQLRAAGQEVGLLLLIDAGFPGRPKHMVERMQHNGLTALADYYLGEVLLRSPKDRLVYVAARLRNLARRAVRALRKFSSKSHLSSSDETNLERIMRHVKQANIKAADSYVPQHYAGKVTLFWCSDTPLRAYRDRRMAWSQVAEGGLEVHAIPGNHLTMVDYPHVTAMAEELRICLSKNQRPSARASAAD